MVILHHLPIFTWFGAFTSHFFFLQKNRLNRGKSGHFFTQKPRSNRKEQKRIDYFPIAHNTLCLPPKFCITYCLKMLLGKCNTPRSI